MLSNFEELQARFYYYGMGTNIDYYPSSLARKTAVTLVAHGLNLKPEAMLPLANWLTSQGSEVYLVKLSGHQQNGVAIEEITSSLWQTEIEAGYQMAKNAALHATVPLFLLGYSMGALLVQSMIAPAMKTAPFDKQILFAPATAIRPWAYLVKLLLIFGKRRKLPSYTPVGYRANDSLPLFVYKILFTEERKLLQSKFHNLNLPTLVFLDPKDELISYKKLVRHISRFSLTKYKIITLENNRKNKKTEYHHLIIDEQTLGERNWKRVTAEIKMFLFSSPG